MRKRLLSLYWNSPYAKRSEGRYVLSPGKISVRDDNQLRTKSFMNFSLHQEFSELPAESWNALVEQSITDTPFSRYEYLSEWWQTLGGGEWQNVELVLVSASENGQLVGIAPLFIADYDGQRALMLVGSIEISDYLDLIV